MSNISIQAPVDPYVENMKSARNKPAVLKHQLISLRSKIPDTLIFVFEGVEDKIVYFQWIKRVRPDLDYEPFICKGKNYVLELREVAFRDMGNIKEGVYFFVDRDFDGLCGHTPHDSTFMTETYSTENYLVTSDVLEEVLRNEFHCHSKPDERQPMLYAFEDLYTQFLEITSELNYRIFVARRLGLRVSNMPKKLSQIVSLQLNTVSPPAQKPDKIITYDRDIDPTSIIDQRADFEKLDPKSHYRGHFCYMFFSKWLTLLADDYSSATSNFFAAIDRSAKVRSSEIGLGSLASKSQLPPGLQDFILAITPPN